MFNPPTNYDLKNDMKTGDNFGSVLTGAKRLHFRRFEPHARVASSPLRAALPPPPLVIARSRIDPTSNDIFHGFQYLYTLDGVVQEATMVTTPHLKLRPFLSRTRLLTSREKLRVAENLARETVRPSVIFVF